MIEINGFSIPKESILLEPRAFLDSAIIGFDQVVIYDYFLLIDAFVDMGMSFEEASEWVNYNSIRAGDYVSGWPQIIEEDDDERD